MRAALRASRRGTTFKSAAAGVQSAVSLTAIDGESISGSSQSNFLGNGYYTRKGFTRAANWTGSNPLGGSFAGWDDPNFIPIGTFLTDFAGTAFYSRMDDLGLTSMLPAAGSISLANNITYGKGAVVTDESHAGGTIASGDDPGVVGVSSGEEPFSAAGYDADVSVRAAWLATSDGAGRFGFYNFADNILNGDIENVYFPVDMMTSADFVTCDQYWCAGAADAAPVSQSKLHFRLYQTSGSATQTQCARGSHYGSMMDCMRKNLNSTTTHPFQVWIENGAPYTEAASLAITPAQMKWAVWSTLVHGARGIGYYNHSWRGGDPLMSNNNFENDGYGGPGIAGTGIYAAAKEVNLRALQIAPVINAPRDGYFVYGDGDTSGSIATSGFLTAVTSTNARSKYAGVDACCKWQPVEGTHYILATTREPEASTNIPVTFRMVDQGQTTAVPLFSGSNITITRGGAIPGGFCEFSDTFATAAAYKCYRIEGASAPTIGAIGTRLAGSDTTTAQVAVPAGVAAGHIIVVMIRRGGGVAAYDPFTSLPSGFQLVPHNPGIAAVSVSTALDVAWKRATGNDTGTYDFTWTRGEYRVAFALRIDGCRTTGDPFETDDGAGEVAPRDGNSPAVSVTTTAANRLLLWGAATWDAGAWTMPTGFTQQVSDASLDLITCGSKEQAVAGSSGSLVGSQPVTSTRCAWVGAFVGGG